ncbi:MAG: polysaccharide deacetylase, partial [Desulfovibrio sp.]
MLCYHNLGGNGVPFENFSDQMRWLKAKGVRSLSLEDVKEYMRGERIKGPKVLITFDDGFRDIYTRAAPLLKELGFQATVFMITSRIRPEHEPGQEDDIVSDEAHEHYVLTGKRAAWLSRGEIREMLHDGVIELGSHSVRHRKYRVSKPRLSEIPYHWAYAPYRQLGETPVPVLAPELAGPICRGESPSCYKETTEQFSFRVEQELRQSREALEALSGGPITAMAWPWGAYCRAGQRAAQAAGFELLFTTKRGA